MFRERRLEYKTRRQSGGQEVGSKMTAAWLAQRQARWAKGHTHNLEVRAQKADKRAEIVALVEEGIQAVPAVPPIHR